MSDNAKVTITREQADEIVRLLRLYRARDEVQLHEQALEIDESIAALTGAQQEPAVSIRPDSWLCIPHQYEGASPCPQCPPDRTQMTVDQKLVQRSFQECQAAINAETHGGVEYEDDEQQEPAATEACGNCSYRNPAGEIIHQPVCRCSCHVHTSAVAAHANVSDDLAPETSEALAALVTNATRQMRADRQPAPPIPPACGHTQLLDDLERFLDELDPATVDDAAATQDLYRRVVAANEAMVAAPKPAADAAGTVAACGCAEVLGELRASLPLECRCRERGQGIGPCPDCALLAKVDDVLERCAGTGESGADLPTEADLDGMQRWLDQAIADCDADDPRRRGYLDADVRILAAARAYRRAKAGSR